MVNLNFTETINAPANKVWFALWDDAHYRKWTATFCEGSYAVSEWKKGSRVHFLGPDGRGMYADIAELVPNEKMYFTHIGELKNFEEQPVEGKTSEWSGAQENYTLVENNGVTTLTVLLQSVENYMEYMQNTFPQALARVKELAEDLYIEVSVTVNQNLETVWNNFTRPEHITQWNSASPEWHTPRAENNPVTGGAFSYRMEARDGSMGFDFSGVYSEVVPQKSIAYAMSDGRRVVIEFTQVEDGVLVSEKFHPENENPFELQRDGWQAILNSFKAYTELR